MSDYVSKFVLNGSEIEVKDQSARNLISSLQTTVANNTNVIADHSDTLNTLSSQVASNTVNIQTNANGIQTNSTNIFNNARDIAVLSGRVDTFASLPSGSTSGNAELLDIRVSADGLTYSSAGDAVRGQFKQADNLAFGVQRRVNSINKFNGNVNVGLLSFDAGDPYGKLQTPLNTNYWYTDLIEVGDSTNINVVAGFDANVTGYIIFYDSTKQCISSYAMKNPFTNVIPSTAKYYCVMSVPAFTNTMLIMDKVPDRYYAVNESVSTDVNDLKFTYKRLDRGYFTGKYYGVQPSGHIFPMQTSANIKGSYLVPVEGLSYISYINNNANTGSSYFVDHMGNNMGTDYTIPANSKGSIAVPSGAYAYFYMISVNADLDNKFTVVAGQKTLERPYGYDEKEIDYAGELDSVLKDKKVLFIGDSITAGVYYNGGWCTLVGERTGADVTNEGHDGYTVGKLADRTDNLIDVLNGITGDFDMIVLSGGYNDLTTSPRASLGSVTPYTYSELDPYTFAGGIESYIKLARNKFPTAKICYILTMRKMWANQNITNDQTTWWNVIRECCNKWSIPCLDLAKESALVGDQVTAGDTITNMYYHNADGTHPNQAGYEYLTPMITHFLERFF